MPIKLRSFVLPFRIAKWAELQSHRIVSILFYETLGVGIDKKRMLAFKLCPTRTFGARGLLNNDCHTTVISQNEK